MPDNLSKPHILITNDDGIQAAGLRALVEAMQSIAQITVVAPSHERSASAQSLTLRQPIYCDQIAENEYSVEGTPADAVILAFHTLLKEKPDLVISGINRGGNMGENVYYSGTVGAAMEGAINRVPAIAVSVSYKSKELDYAPAANFTRTLVPLILAEGLPPGILLNVNVPQSWNGRSPFHPPVLEDHAQRAPARRRSRAAAAIIGCTNRSVLRTSSPTRT